MCSRLAQYGHPLRYTEFLGLPQATLLFDNADRRPGFNLAPGSHPLAVCPDNALRRLLWGYRSASAARDGLPGIAGANASNMARDAACQALWLHGRVVIPVDGWYEWSTQDGKRQPWFIRLQAEAPMFLAALADLAPAPAAGAPQMPGQTGFMLITAVPERGLVAAADRRPLVLCAADARRWLDPLESRASLQALSAGGGLHDSHFTAYPVSHAIERSGADGAALIAPQAS